MNEDNTRCEALVPDGGRSVSFHQCHKMAYAMGEEWGKIKPLCRIHHPDEIAKRKAARGPTQWEKDMVNLNLQRALAALAHKLAEALEKVEPILLGYPILGELESDNGAFIGPERVEWLMKTRNVLAEYRNLKGG